MWLVCIDPKTSFERRKVFFEIKGSKYKIIKCKKQANFIYFKI
jgi:hypothetical protein